jgi:hypothetical protein
MARIVKHFTPFYSENFPSFGFKKSVFTFVTLLIFLKTLMLFSVYFDTKNGKVTAVNSLEKSLVKTLSELGRIARVQDLTDELFGRATTPRERAHVAFIAELAAK